MRGRPREAPLAPVTLDPAFALRGPWAARDNNSTNNNIEQEKTSTDNNDHEATTARRKQSRASLVRDCDDAPPPALRPGCPDG